MIGAYIEYRKYGEDMGEKWETCGKICETYGETMENMGGKYGGHMGKIWGR